MSDGRGVGGEQLVAFLGAWSHRCRAITSVASAIIPEEVGDL